MLTPYALTTDGRAAPLGIDERTPLLSWRLTSERRGDAQTAYRIVVTENGVTRWDTGRVESAENSGLAYDGPALHSRTRYDWRVTVWDADGAEAGSAESWFETAVLHPDEWAGVWIARDPDVHPPFDPPVVDDLTDRVRHLPAPPHLRRAFRLSEKPTRARLYATARGAYEPRVNGSRIGDRELAPGWTEYRTRVLYQTYDVTDALQAGENVLGAVLADGWWSGFVGFDSRHQAQHYGDAPQFLAQLVVEFADGSTRTIATDSEWVERPGAIRYADMLMGQYEDATQAIPGWDTPGYDASSWTPVKIVDEKPGALVAEPDEPIRVTEDLHPVSVTALTDGRHLVDFGQNMVGRVRLTIHGAKAGRRIRLRHAEVLEDGELYLENLRTAEATDIYLAGGAATEVFEPSFTFHGFRYVEIVGYPGQLHARDVVGRVLHSDTPFTGSFECDDETVNQLYRNIRWGQRGNWVSVPTDCPQRDERLGWLADAQIFAPTAMRNADVQAFFARWLTDVQAAATPEGAFPDIAPKVAMITEGAPAWGDAGVIIPWLLYRVYGDKRTLERSFDSMTAWIAHVHRHNPDLVWRHRTGNNYGDWLQVDADTPRDLLATAYFAQSTALVAAAARVLGKDAKPYEDLHERIKEAFNDAFVEDDGRVTGDTQTGYLLALAFDLLPSHLTEPAAARLAADVEKRDNHLTTGFVGVALLCPVLARHGRADLAYALLHQDTYPSWGYSIVHGATTIWERWDGWTADRGFQAAQMNSFNHYSLGSIGDWLYGGVAGIDQAPGSVGYRELLLRPTVGGLLTWAKASQETVRGRVSSGWRIQGDDVVVEVEIPPGATADLLVPTSDPASIRDENGEAVPGPELRLGSGTYRFTASR
ncbi:alpha-L-rhamnosidase [Cryptosporangium aurantiacum]|uniref:alpha-L-rhamnosidase n=1 Tax=Cryptosporangium aurantiacum TaxID=134849 RepID=A0A1M7N9F6_9ACTN|nr:alpha-L-rhamnosidase [Cryptosporangium aurantiacum]SHN00195.1 alpha-L-rhamnosidase [Cryptosporangium aurantiacum]